MGSFSSTPNDSGDAPINPPTKTLTAMHVLPPDTPAFCYQFDIPDDQLKIAEPALSKKYGGGAALAKGSCTAIGYTSRKRSTDDSVHGMADTVRVEWFGKAGTPTNAVQSVNQVLVKNSVLIILI